MAAEADLSIICGDDVVIPITIYDGDDGTTPLNLTGVTAITYIVRRDAGDSAAALISKSLGAGIAVVSAVAGTITLTLQDTDTLPLTGDRIVGAFAHELRVVDSGGLRSTVIKGTLKVLDTVAA